MFNTALTAMGEGGEEGVRLGSWTNCSDWWGRLTHPPSSLLCCTILQFIALNLAAHCCSKHNLTSGSTKESCWSLSFHCNRKWIFKAMCFSEKFYWLPKSQGLRIARQTFELIQGQLELPYSVSTSKHSKQVKTYELMPICNEPYLILFALWERIAKPESETEQRAICFLPLTLVT